MLGDKCSEHHCVLAVRLLRQVSPQDVSCESAPTSPNPEISLEKRSPAVANRHGQSGREYRKVPTDAAVALFFEEGPCGDPRALALGVGPVQRPVQCSGVLENHYGHMLPDNKVVQETERLPGTAAAISYTIPVVLALFV